MDVVLPLQLGSGLLQHKPTLGTIAADIEPMVLDDGTEADIEDDAENVSFGNLRRIGSGTALAGTGRTIRVSLVFWRGGAALATCYCAKSVSCSRACSCSIVLLCSWIPSDIETLR